MSSMVKSTGIYAFSTVVRQAVSFLMLPVYTRYLSPHDYGVVEMLSLLVILLSLTAGAHIGLATIRQYSLCTCSESRTSLFCTSFLTTMGLGVATYLVVYIAGCIGLLETLAEFVFGERGQTGSLLLFCTLIVLQPMEEQLLIQLRLRDRPWAVFGLSLLKLALQLTLNIVFIVTLGFDVLGMIYASVCATLATATVSALTISRSLRTYKLDFPSAYKLISYAGPLAIGALGFMYMNVGDRYILQYLHGSTAVGIYALGIRFADILNAIAWAPFLMVWQTKRFELARDPTEMATHQLVFGSVFIFLVSIGLGISLLTDDVLPVMSSSEFQPAAAVTPPMVLFNLLSAATAFASFPSLYAGKTSHVAQGYWFSAIVMTIAYGGLVPEFGAVGAAWSKVLAAFAQLVFLLFVGRKYDIFHLDWLRYSSLIFAALLFYILSEYMVGLIDSKPYLAVVLQTFAVLLFLSTGIFCPPFLDNKVRTSLVGSIRQLVRTRLLS